MNSNIKAMYGLTPIQQGMLLHSDMSSVKGQYSVRLFIRTEGDLSSERLGGAFQKLIGRHEILRTAFLYRKSKTPLQAVLNDRKGKTHAVDFKGEVYSETLMNRFWDTLPEMDPEKDILIECALFEFSDTKAISLRFHHILLDGWSLGIVLDDFKNIINGRKCTIDEKELFPFSEYIKALKRTDKTESLKYWEKYLDSYEQGFTLTPDKGEGKNYSKLVRKMDKKDLKNLEKFLKDNEISLNTAFQTAWGLVLQKYLYSDDVIFGSVVSGRNLPVDGIEKGVGLFINTLPLRIRTKPSDTVMDILKRVQKHMDESCSHESMNLTDIREVAGIKTALFDHITAFENYPFSVSEDEKEEGVRFTEVKGDERNNYSINVKSMLVGDEFSVEITYDTDSFSEKRAARMAELLTEIMKAMGTDPFKHPGEITSADESEREVLLSEFIGPYRDFSQYTLKSLLKDRFGKNPDLPAVSDRNARYTYEETDRITDNIASWIRKKGLVREDVVGLYMERSAEAVLAMIGLLKAGVAFLPMDISIPEDRVEFMLSDSGAKLLLEDGKGATVNFNGERIKSWFKEASQAESYAFEEPSDKDLAYIIYTSGTTGKPKGTMMERRGLLNLIMEMEYRYPQDNIPVVAISSMAFDMFLYEYTYCLGRQGEFTVSSETERKDMDELFRLLEDMNIKSMITTPSRINLMADHPKAEKVFGDFKTLIIGGETLRSETFKKVKAITGGEIQNAYGPTETTVICLIKENLEDQNAITIGKPLLNTKLLVLGKNLELLPVGAVGELYIVTPGILRGYLKREELTAEVKKECPYYPGEYMYKSGDFVRWTENGEIDFLGRTDGQHKLRGQRIELSEIENRILKISGIEEVIVDILGEEQHLMKLAAFYKGLETEREEFRNRLKDGLPHYMIPEIYIHVDEIPVTDNGKANKRKLRSLYKPEEEMEKIKLPETEIQERIHSIWEEVLGRTNPGTYTDFYGAGGNSLSAMSLTSRLSREFGKQFRVSEILQHMTVTEQEKLVLMKTEKKEAGYHPESELLTASRAEKRMFLLEKKSGDSCVYSTYLVLEAKGELPSENVEDAVIKMQEIHESLSSIYIESHGEIYKKRTAMKIPVLSHLMKREDFISDGGNLITPMDPEKCPPWQVHYVRTEDSVMLLFAFSHIIMDGFSMDIFMRDFTEVLGGKLPYQGNKEATPRNYSDFAWYEKNMDFKKHSDFFSRYLEGASVCEIFTDMERTDTESFRGGRTTKSLSGEKLRKLRRILRERKLTVNSCLMSLAGILLSGIGNTRDITMGTVTANRDLDEFRNTVGMFVSTLPVRHIRKDGETFSGCCSSYQENINTLMEHQMYPYDLTVRKFMEKNPGCGELIKHMFIYQSLEGALYSRKCGDAVICPCTDFHVPEGAKYELTFEAMDYPEELKISLSYAQDLYGRSTAEKITEAYIYLIEKFIENPDVSADETGILTDRMKEYVLSLTKGTATEYSDEDTIVAKIHKNAHKFPELPALEAGDKVITFGKLEEETSLLAGRLIAGGAEKGDILGIISERDENFVIAMIAAMKAGCGCLPVDITLPEERIRFMTENSGMKFAVSDRELSVPHINIRNKDYKKEKNISLAGLCTLSSPAYITYTSGTTGTPKGVLLNQNSVTNLISNADRYLPLKKGMKLLSLASVSFDMFASEVVIALWHGMCLVMTGDEERYSVEKTTEIMKEKKIDAFIATPSRVENSLDLMEKKGVFENLKFIMLGGESVSDHLTMRIWKIKPDFKIFNAYGPTEATMYCTNGLIEKGKKISIGTPVPGSRLFILDSSLNLSWPGAAGEICAGGKTLAEGYIGLPGETSKKFIDHPEFGRIYRTGDRGRYDRDGRIIFLGRDDGQVKINGYRVETSEIENVISAHTSGSQVRVTARKKDGKWELLAFTATDINIPALRNIISKVLPYYMVPKDIIKVESIPETSNGKCNDRLLLKMYDSVSGKGSKARPESQEEIILERILRGKLDLKEETDMNSHFMDLGGDSFRAIEVISALRNEGYTIGIQKFMNHRDLKDLAGNLKVIVSLEKENVSQERFLSPMHCKVLEHNGAEAVNGFTQTVLLSHSEKIDWEKLKTVIFKIMDEHRMLTSCFPYVGGKRVHLYRSPEKALNMTLTETYEYSGDYIDGLAGKRQKEADINDRLFMADIINTEKDGGFILLTLHHFLLDTVSWMILLEEIMELYNGKRNEVRKSSASFSDFLRVSEEFIKSGGFSGEEEYWRKTEETEEGRFTPNYVKDMELTELNFTLEETLRISEYTKKRRISQDSLLISALSENLTKITRRDDILLELESHGRSLDFSDIDLSQSVGWYTSPYPVLIEKKKSSPEDVQKTLGEVPGNGRLYSINRYISVNSDYNTEPSFVFNNLGKTRNSVETSEGLKMSGHQFHNIPPENFCVNYEIYTFARESKGILSIGVQYSRLKYSAGEMEGLINNIRNTVLRNVTELKSHELI